MYLFSYSTGLTPIHTTLTNPNVKYYQYLYINSTTLQGNSSSNVKVALYIQSFRTVAIQGFNYLNISDVLYNGNGVLRFTLYVRYAVVQEVCVSAVYCNYDLMKENLLLNASLAASVVNSSLATDTLPFKVAANLGINSVYGPIFDYKCAIGLSAFQLSTTNTTTTSLLFDFTATPTIPAGYTPNMPLYILNYTSFCYVRLQCQYLYQQYYVAINDCQDTCSISNCLSCTTAYSCASCEAGYFVNSLLRCSACIGNCSSCSNVLTCDRCSNGYYYNTTLGSCELC